jgi:hypothetical protein
MRIPNTSVLDHLVSTGWKEGSRSEKQGTVMMSKEGATSFFPMYTNGKAYKSKAHVKQVKLEEQYEKLAEKAEARTEQYEESAVVSA